MNVTEKTSQSKAFQRWHSDSAVRSLPYRYEVTVDDFSVATPRFWFPPILIPALDHPAVAALPEQSLLHVHVKHLVHFLDYTTELEVGHVNGAVELMVTGALRKYFSNEERSVLLKLYVDEGYHALFSKDMADQIAHFFRLERSGGYRVFELKRFERECPSQFRELGAFVVAFVSETIVVRELSTLSRADLIRPIYHMFRDHLHDEGQHARVFMNCFVKLWGQLCVRDRDFVVDALVKVIHIFCRPDKVLNEVLFGDLSCSGDGVAEFLELRWRARIPRILEVTLMAIKRTDLLLCANYSEKFKRSGLLGEC